VVEAVSSAHQLGALLSCAWPCVLGCVSSCARCVRGCVWRCVWSYANTHQVSRTLWKTCLEPVENLLLWLWNNCGQPVDN